MCKEKERNVSVLRLYIYHDENCNTSLRERQRGTLFIHNFTKKEGRSLSYNNTISNPIEWTRHIVLAENSLTDFKVKMDEIKRQNDQDETFNHYSPVQ